MILRLSLYQIRFLYVDSGSLNFIALVHCCIASKILHTCVGPTFHFGQRYTSRLIISTWGQNVIFCVHRDSVCYSNLPQNWFCFLCSQPVSFPHRFWTTFIHGVWVRVLFYFIAFVADVIINLSHVAVRLRLFPVLFFFLLELEQHRFIYTGTWEKGARHNATARHLVFTFSFNSFSTTHKEPRGKWCTYRNNWAPLGGI